MNKVLAMFVSLITTFGPLAVKQRESRTQSAFDIVRTAMENHRQLLSRADRVFTALDAMRHGE